MIPRGPWLVWPAGKPHEGQRSGNRYAGKTMTKDMIAAVLAESFSVLATEGNMNNEIGLPLTLFGCSPVTTWRS